MFKDEHKISQGTIIDISREKGYVLCTSSKSFRFPERGTRISLYRLVCLTFRLNALSVTMIAVDGKEVESTESEVLCRSILDLYIGDDPFDKNAKEDFERNARALLRD